MGLPGSMSWRAGAARSGRPADDDGFLGTGLALAAQEVDASGQTADVVPPGLELRYQSASPVVHHARRRTGDTHFVRDVRPAGRTDGQRPGRLAGEVRRSEYARLESDHQRRFIKGQRYTLLSRRAHLSYCVRRVLKLLLQANKRLQVACLLKESFDRLWSYRSEGWAQMLFWDWQQALR